MNKFLKTIMTLCLCPLLGHAQKYVGGDISLLPTYEAHGVHYLDQNGSQVEPLPYFGEQAGWNAMRVRIFVDPSKASAEDQSEGVRQDLDYVTTLCQRIKAQGYALMLDFHYSDTWTDPGQHATPSAWTSSDPAVLADSVYQYTVRCLTHLKANGVVPEFIQPGNEITYGMLWPTGHCYPDGSNYTTTAGTGTFANMVSYLKAGIRGCREVCPDAKIVVHTEMSKAWNVTTFYNTLGSQVDYDIIGLSYYPDYHGTLSTFSGVLTTLESQHADKEIMVVETGYGAQWSLNGTYSSTVQATWPCTEAGQMKFTDDLITELNNHPKVTGLFWWMPEDNEFWADANPARSTWWNASLYIQNTGKPLAAMFELQRFIGLDPTGIALPSASSAAAQSAGSSSTEIYNLQGQRQSSPSSLPRGIYIRGGQKFVVR
ncbi:MAG: glycosyl hydrolase 53 family protein [Prevotella sp.]|nr:glycosyl hydrolase 53 family protein [Prevotella sp.]